MNGGNRYIAGQANDFSAQGQLARHLESGHSKRRAHSEHQN